MSLEQPHIAIIGGGKMGEAIVAGCIACGQGIAAQLDARSFTVANPGAARRDYLTQRYGVACVATAAEIEAPDVAILAVKPQVLKEALAPLRDHAAYAQALFISIAAGLGTARIQAALPARARLVRAMPNLPLSVSAGATALCASASALPGDLLFAQELFSCLGSSCVVDEACMDAVCALSGSGPAYVCLFIESLTAAAEELGLAHEQAAQLALQTVLGTAMQLARTAESPAALREAVCSPGGTTLAALEALHRAGFAEAVSEGVFAAARRSKELTQC